MTRLASQAKAASRELARLTTAEKNACLLAMADALEKNAAAIKTANAQDMEFAASHGLSNAMLDRLKLDDQRITGMARGLREVAALPDPVGKILDERVRPNGLRLQKISTHRRGGHYLRITPQCDRRCGQSLFQVRQCGDYAGRQGGVKLQPDHCPDND